MTSEEATRCYNSEQSRYYDYCGYIRSYENKISEYRSQRRKKCIEIDNKKDEIKKNEDLLESISNSTNNKDSMFSHLGKINTRVSEAATNFTNMVSASAVKAANLSNSFGEEATKANSKLSDIYQHVDNAKRTISNEIERLTRELRALEAEVNTLDSNISRAQGMISEYEGDKQRCLANMAYYRKFM